MKIIQLINYSIILCVSLCVLSCRTNKLPTIPVETKTVIRERLVEVQTPADSAWLTAYLECDSNFNVLLKRYDEHKTSGMSTGLKIDTGTISYQVIRIRDNIYIPAKDSIIYKDIPIPVEVPVEINRLTGWQQFQIWCGRIYLVIMVLVIAWLIYRFTK